ncbi:hypothetical protein, partial [Yersinia pestis]|uniref:hypothetical protein n=1 Tax=Yersinia pestis TaxID=632 RepID=UPI001BB32379
GLPDGSPFIFVRVKTASAVTLWFNLFMVQLVYGSTCLWFNLFMVQLVYGSTCLWFNLFLVQLAKR